MNNLFQQLGGMNNNNSMLQQFMEFKKNFTGDPKQIVQQMLNSGKMTQNQFNDLANRATQIQKMFRL